MLHSKCQLIWKTQHWLQDWKRLVFIPIPKKSNAKECSNYHTTALISHANKVMLKIHQARLQQYMNWELPDVQTGLRKDREIRDQITSVRWLIEKAREFQKDIYICFIGYTKAFASPGEGNGNPFQYSCLENPINRGAWQAIVHWVARVGHDLTTKPPPAESLWLCGSQQTMENS